MYREIYEAAPDAILLVARDGTILLANAEAHRVFEYERGSLVGMPLDVLLPDAVRPAHAAHRERYFETPRKRRMGESLDLVARKRSGDEFPVDISLGPFTYEGTPAVLSVIRDITDRKRLEQALARTELQLRHSQKLQAMGLLAGGVAHDFNNLLTVVLGYANLLLATLPADSGFRADVAEIQRAGEKGDHLTKQLLAFSRHQVMVPRVFDLHPCVERTSTLFGRLLPASFSVALELRADHVNVNTDTTQLELVLMNLLVNARDAMPDGGTILLRSSNVTLDSGTELVDLAPGAYLRLDIVDQGVGMDAATRDRVFEPFFTTKDIGKGTGLGLSTAYGIMRQMSGDITVQSEPGRGSTFSLFLPVSDALPLAAAPRPNAGQSRSGNETILLVEDDDSVRAALATVLQRHGYTVLSASNPRDALVVADAHSGPIALLITDMMMPYMNGLELANRLLRARPSTKVLCISGQTEHPLVWDESMAPFSFMPKPITPPLLLERVRELLDAVG